MLDEKRRRELQDEYEELNATILRLQERREWRQRALGQLEELEAEGLSLARLEWLTSPHREKYRALRARLAELGQLLGYW